MTFLYVILSRAALKFLPNNQKLILVFLSRNYMAYQVVGDEIEILQLVQSKGRGVIWRKYLNSWVCIWAFWERTHFFERGKITFLSAGTRMHILVGLCQQIIIKTNWIRTRPKNIVMFFCKNISRTSSETLPALFMPLSLKPPFPAVCT